MWDELLQQVLIRKFLKFGIVGFSGIFVDFGFTWVFREKVNIHQLVANAIGFITASVSNYYLNRVWTFRSSNPEIAVEFTQFFVISLIGLIINTLILWLILKKMKINFYIAKAFAILVVMIWNFTANLFVTFG